jgi:hypothetical protein
MPPNRSSRLILPTISRTLGIWNDQPVVETLVVALLLSTLRKTVQAVGGNLSLVAEFPDRAPVVLSGIAEPDA